MDKEVVAVFIPIILFLVTGLVAVVYLYLRSRERQMLIEKNLDAEAIKEFFNNKRNYDPFRLLKVRSYLFVLRACTWFRSYA